MIAKLGNLAVGRQFRVKYGRQFLIKAAQYSGMGKDLSKPRAAVLHQRLNAFELVAGFERGVRHL